MTPKIFFFAIFFNKSNYKKPECYGDYDKDANTFTPKKVRERRIVAHDIER